MKIGNISIEPTKIVCLGKNYAEHAKEMKSEVPSEPMFFCKTLNCLILNNQPIIYPRFIFDNDKYRGIDHEVELAVIVNKKCKNVSINDAYNFILGYSVFLDITARTMQKIDRDLKNPWYRSKSFDTFGPIGPRIALTKEIPDPHDLNIQLKVNGQIRQSSNTKHMIFKIPELIEYISKFVTLEPGDIIATGTPEGVGPIQPGDVIEASIEGIGTIVHNVILEKVNFPIS